MDQERTEDKDYQSDWAFNNDFSKYIHISDAESGLNGYFCLGCKKEMQAAKGKVRTHYFRHHAKDVKKDYTKCVRANRQYRELIARDILQRLKELKVPTVFKYPTKNSDGLPNELLKAHTVKAFKVKSELTFYEDENYVVHYGQNPEVIERNLLIRPDITFFDAKNAPILLVEFVVTHKIDNEKKVKLRRLGLNTVQIIIPKKSEIDIEKALKSRTKVKWVYNEIEAKSKYIYIPQPHSGGIREIDDEQRRIFEESYKCRTIQIKNLIRTISRSLESQPYQRTEQHLDREISGVEKATKAEKKRLADMEERIEREIFDELRDARERIESKENRFQDKSERLVERYYGKRRDIKDQQDEVERLTYEQLNDYKSEEQITENYRKKAEAIDRDIRYEESRVKDFIREKGIATAEFKQLEKSERINFDESKKSIGKQETEIEVTVRTEFNREIKSDARKLPKGVKDILEAQRMGNDFKDAKREEKRYKSARKLFNSGAWKT